MLTAAGLAGCAGGRPGSPTETPTDAPDDPPHSFAVSATRCGTQVDRADVTFGEGTVTLEGTTWGNDACYTARLEALEWDGETLRLSVAAERAADDDRGCAECISEIDYRATVEVSAPSEVVVVHRGETVAIARP